MKFLEPADPVHTFTSKDVELSRYAASYEGSPYYSLLAQVTRPTGNGFWATYITVYPGENLADKIIERSDEEKKKIIEAYLTSGWSLSHYDSSFQNPLGQINADTDPNGGLMKNNTTYIITWFKNRHGNWELMLDGSISNG